MGKKEPLHGRVKALEDKVNELVGRYNDMQNTQLPEAFNQIKKDMAKLEKRIEHLEDVMLVGDFKQKIAANIKPKFKL
jgi:predicted nuclease with TOPRIM domain